MNPSRRRLLVTWAAALCGYAIPTAPLLAQDRASTVIEMRIEHRRLVAPESNVIRVTEGDTLELRCISDEAVELHLHGYDQILDVGKDGTAAIVVEARATGRFPIEVHQWGGHGHGHETLAYLEVHPR